MPELTFDITIKALATVNADTVEDAVAVLKGLPPLLLQSPLSAISLSNGVFDVEQAELIEVDDKDVHGPFFCRLCGAEVFLLGGRWRRSVEDNPEICVFEGRITSGPHDPWDPWYCQNCAYLSTESEFLPSDGSDSYRCSKCGSTDVFFVIPFKGKERP